MTPTLHLLTTTLIELAKHRKYHEDKLAGINEQIASHEAVLKIIEDEQPNT